MRITDLIHRSSRSLKSAKARTLLTALAIAVGTFALTLTLAASNGAQHFTDKLINDNFDPSELIVTKDEAVFGRGDQSKPKEYDETFGESAANSGASVQIKRLTENDINQLKNNSSIEQVREGIIVNLLYLTRKDQKRYVGTVVAFSPAQHPELLAGSIPRPLKNKQVLLPEGYIKALGFKDPAAAIGQPINLAIRKAFNPDDLQSALSKESLLPNDQRIKELTKSSVEEETYTIAAVLKNPTTSQPGTELYMYVGEDDARSLYDVATQNTPEYRKYAYAYVRVRDGNDKTKLKAVQEQLKKGGFTSQSVEDTQKFLTQIIGVLRGIVAAFGAIAVIASLFGIVNTMYISVLQRTREIGLMKALGMRKKDIGWLFRFEAAWIGLLGGVIGSLLAFGVGTVLNPWITKKLNLGSGQNLLIYRPKQTVILILLLIVISVLAGWLPSRKAAKLDPIEALRTE